MIDKRTIVLSVLLAVLLGLGGWSLFATIALQSQAASHEAKLVEHEKSIVEVKSCEACNQALISGIQGDLKEIKADIRWIRESLASRNMAASQGK